MIELRKLSVNDGADIYEMLQEIPREENGFMNSANGMSREEFSKWLESCHENSVQKDIAGGWKVPSTTYWLYVDGRPAGFGKLRHFLTDSLRQAGGHIGYAVRPSMRGRGYGKQLLRLLLAEAKNLGIRQALITIHKDNAASIAVAKANGGTVSGETEERYLFWIET